MSEKTLLITGMTSFTGRSYLKESSSLNYDVIIGQGSNNYFKFENENLIEIENEEYLKILSKSSEINLLHLATFYSLNDEYKNKIYEANVEFGKNILNLLKNYQLKKIVYTNSLFAFNKNSMIRNSDYVKTKLDFSEILNEFSLENNIFFNEIYLDNTFGFGDNRNKILPIILSSIVNNEPNPVQNPKNYINLINIYDLIKTINSLMDIENSLKFAIYSKNDFEIKSIYEFCKKYYQKKELLKIKSKKTIIDEKIPTSIKKIEIEYDIQKLLTSTIKNI
tara:strand:+ start:2713 stop:3549 length:837 start_codon:yes stop_codon:yes gene_type:complete